MAYFWLNQRKESGGYKDIIGEVYHYRSNTSGAAKLSVDDHFVYYQPGAGIIFGGGRIQNIETKEKTSQPDKTNLTEYFAHIDKYISFDPPVDVRKIKDDISFLRGRKGLRGVPQNSIQEINLNDFTTILKAADQEDLIKK